MIVYLAGTYSRELCEKDEDASTARGDPAGHWHQRIWPEQGQLVCQYVCLPYFVICKISIINVNAVVLAWSGQFLFILYYKVLWNIPIFNQKLEWILTKSYVKDT